MGSSMSATYTSARDPAKTTRIRNHSQIGNETEPPNPSPWWSCHDETSLKTGVYWIESGFPTWCGLTKNDS